MNQFIHPTNKLGKRAPRADLRTLKLKDYLQVLPPQPPAQASWVTDVPAWPMDLNDQLGDCVIAAMSHMVQQWTFYVAEKRQSGTQVILPDSDVLKGYEDVGGYVPGNPGTDNGCSMLQALNYWRKTGLGGHKILAFAQVDPTNVAEWKTVIALFGSVFAGLAMPISAQTQVAWTVPDGGAFGDGSPGSWGGHCVPIVAYSDKSNTCVTWGQTLKMSHNFIRNYCDEAYVALSQDWIDSQGISPSLFNLAQLQADLLKL